ncbi:hypothetical protein OG422_19510 [Streptomyces sp. NBC_01525]|uniref:hypothetical protein n=1 Tax=Streptomyces sp. NBC_01525 TaxID=2903893 RepID=UPI00386493BE
MFSTQKRAAALLITGAAATGALAMAPAASATPSDVHVAGSGIVKGSATLWAKDVNAHQKPYVSSKVTARHLGGTVPVKCQKKGGNVSYHGYKNNWWVNVPGKGWVSAVFFKDGANWKPVPGIRGC